MKRALFVSYSYPPSRVPSAQRPFAFAKYLARRGWQIHVLTPRDADSALGFDETVTPIEGVTVHHTGNFEPFKPFREMPKEGDAMARASGGAGGSLSGKLKARAKRFVRENIFHPDRARFWHRHAVKGGLEVIHAQRPDLIFGTAPMFTNLWVARDLARQTRLPWVADIRDLFAVMPHPTSRPNKFDRELERSAIAESDAVIFISETFRKIYGDAFPADREKMSVIYNGYDPEEFPSADTPPSSGAMTIFYAGSLYGGHRDPSPLWRAIAQLKRERGVTPEDLVVEIAGATEGVRGEEIARLGIAEHVRVLGLLPRSETLQRMTRSHLLWLIVGETAHHTAGVPLKLYEYMAARRPVLAFVARETECAAIIERAKLGVVFGSAESETARVAGVLADYLAKHKSGAGFGVEATDEALKFRRPEQARELEEIFEEVLERRAGKGAAVTV